MRHSNQRDAVLAVVKQAKDHPTADTVYDRVRVQIPDISLGTVYRNLAALVEAKEIITLDAADKSVHYDGNTDGHLHFLCRQCGRIIDLFIKVAPPAELTQMGLEVSGERTVYYGRCDRCNGYQNKITKGAN